MILSDEQKPMYRFLAVMTAASMIGLQGYSILFNNYAVEVVGIDGNGIGIIQSVREIPGLLSVLALVLLLFVKEHRLSALSIVVLGIGTAVTGFFPTSYGLALTTLLMSFGFHYFETTNQSLTLQYFASGISPLVLGRLRSIAAVSSIASGVLIWLLGMKLDYRAIFLIIGSLVAIVGLWALMQDPTHKDLPIQRQKMFLRKKYALFYFLTFMSGARRQIFVVFSIFLLVKLFHFSVREMTVLFIINNCVAYVMNPLIGRAIVTFGERKICSIEYIGVIVIFLTYACTSSKLLVSCMYITDALLFNFSVAIRTYFQKIGDPKDTASSMAVGVTINHIAAVFLPALGGYLWMIDFRIPFYVGALLGCVSLVAAQFIRIPSPVSEETSGC